jgi:hypothetical protein
MNPLLELPRSPCHANKIWIIYLPYCPGWIYSPNLEKLYFPHRLRRIYRSTASSNLTLKEFSA